VSALRTTRQGWTTPLAAVLLVVQGLAGGLVPLAHASERLTAPAHIEAQHASDCPVLHDELRCALCHYPGAQLAPQPARTGAAGRRPLAPRAFAEHVAPARAPDHLTAPPRAPPAPHA